MDSAEVVMEIAVEYILPAEDNRAIGGLTEDVDELARSIEEVGIQEPLIVTKAEDLHYNLVAGERRWLAAKALGMATVPCLIREFGDQEARQVRVIENLHRKDLHPLDEAQAYRTLLESGAGNVEEVAAMVGKSRKYVAGRLELHALCDVARTALMEGRLTAGGAVRIARLPSDMQERVMKDHGGMGASGATNAETVEQWTRWGGYMVDLKDAPFDPELIFLVEGAGACGACPKRTGSDPDLFGEITEDKCLDKKCFKKKVNASTDLLVKGKKVDVRMHGNDYMGVGTVQPTAKHGRDYKKCKKSDEGALKAMVVTGKDKGKTYYVTKSPRPTYGSNYDYEAESLKRDIEWRASRLFANHVVGLVFLPGEPLRDDLVFLAGAVSSVHSNVLDKAFVNLGIGEENTPEQERDQMNALGREAILMVFAMEGLRYIAGGEYKAEDPATVKMLLPREDIGARRETFAILAEEQITKERAEAAAKTAAKAKDAGMAIEDQTDG